MDTGGNIPFLITSRDEYGNHWKFVNRLSVPGSVKYQQVAEDHQQDHNLKDDQVNDEIVSKIINHN